MVAFWFEYPMGSETIKERRPFAEQRSFGFLFAVIFSVLGVTALYRGQGLKPALFCVALLCAGAAQWLPQLLVRPYRLWMGFARVLERFMNPLMMGVIFYGMFTPLALVLKILKRDSLRLKLDPKAKTYWIHRSNNRDCGPGMKFQF